MKQLNNLALIIFIAVHSNLLFANEQDLFWLKIKANNAIERTKIAEMGIQPEIIKKDYVIAYGNELEKSNLERKNILIASSRLKDENIFSNLDFPTEDAIYHNYQELTEELKKIETENSDIVTLTSLAQTVEERNLWLITLSHKNKDLSLKPAVFFMGGHHAREHLSVEIPLKLIQYLIQEYRNNNTNVINYINNRVIYIAPLVNPDGAEYDISNGRYKLWRKNRSQNSNGTFGVDLNRNYGYQWGTGGSSSNPSSETYKGPSAFSEIESTAIKNFIDQKNEITTLLTFHTFSELILYPWGHKYAPIDVTRDIQVFETMATTMSKMNGYTPQQSSELYIASGDTTDWAYGVHKIFAFTFELDPDQSNFDGTSGFYPGASIIEPVFQKNINPCLYLIEHADNPYSVIQ